VSIGEPYVTQWRAIATTDNYLNLRASDEESIWRRPRWPKHLNFISDPPHKRIRLSAVTARDFEFAREERADTIVRIGQNRHNHRPMLTDLIVHRLIATTVG
jgi:hypothetical protein